MANYQVFLRGITIVLLFAIASLANAAPPERPNIVFIMVDDLGREWVSCYGAEDIETPRIDQLAREGMRFLNAYSMPQCTPTRVTLLTGQYPFRHGWVNHWDVPRWGAGCSFDWKHNVSFATQIKKAGYATGIAGKWQINDFRVQPKALRRHGFDEWCVWTGGEGGNLRASGKRYWDPFIYRNVSIPGFEGPSSNVRRQPSGVTGTYEGEFGPDIFNAFCIDFVKRHRDESFLLYYPMVLTHGPRVTTPDQPGATGSLGKHKAMVRYMDKLVGRLVGALERFGVRDETIVVFSTDNGTAGGITGHRNGRTVPGGKAQLTENGMHEPFIVSCPGLVPSGGETESLVDFTDLMPTFCELAGASLPEEEVIDGQSFAAVVLGQREDGPRDWILAMGHGPACLDKQGVRPVHDFASRVIRDKRYKVHISADREITALYDLQADPGEERNLLESDRPRHGDALTKFAAVLERLPQHDARPQYEPTPPRPWDATIEEFGCD